MNIIKLTILAVVTTLAYFVDFSPATSPTSLKVQFVSEAQAILGVRRRAARRGVAVGYAAGESAAAGQASQQQAATAQQQSATAQQQSATAQQQSATAQEQTEATHHDDADVSKSAAAGALALGTVVSTLPGGCDKTASGGIEYYHCGDDYYRAVFQGNNLVYVTTSP